MIKRILLVLFGIALVAQFFQPDRRVPVSDPAQDMLQMTAAPPEIRKLVIGACYDCHSDKTDYPVWAYITPINFWIQGHINEGREVVNFSRWDVFAGNEEAAESGESMVEGEMPPAGYARMHGHARLTASEKQQLISWFNTNLGGAEADRTGRGSEAEEEEHD